LSAWGQGAGLFVLGFVVMTLFYRASVEQPGGEIGVPEHDSYYHVAMALKLVESGAIREFPWLRYTWFRDQGDEFVSHHWGFHILLTPFVKVAEWIQGDPLAGGRWAMAAVFGANLVLFHLLLRLRRVPLHWLWIALFFLLPDQFFARHGYVRAIGASFLFMQLLLWALLSGRRILAAVVTGAYVHLYLGAVMYGPMIVAVVAAAHALGPREDRRILGRTVLYAAAAWLVGVVTYPYAGGMFEFLKMQVFGTGLSPDIEVGREWLPYSDPWFVVRMSAILLAVWTGCLLLRLRFGPRLKAEETALVVLQFLFLLLTLKARRFIEYWPPLCLLSAAWLAAAPLSELRAGTRRWWSVAVTRSGLLRGPARPAGRGRAPGFARAIGIAAAVAALAAGTVAVGRGGFASTARQLRCYYDLSEVRKMMAFLQEDSEPGEVVFTDDWDVFPLFFYHNQHNHYIVGLDPKFTHERDPDLWNRYVKISRGQVPSTIQLTSAGGRGSHGDDAGDLRATVGLEDIRQFFGARYVIADRDHRRLAEALWRDPDFAELVYPAADYEQARSAEYMIFRIREENGPPPVRERSSPQGVPGNELAGLPARATADVLEITTADARGNETTSATGSAAPGWPENAAGSVPAGSVTSTTSGGRSEGEHAPEPASHLAALSTPRVLYLSDLTPVAVRQGWGDLSPDRTVDGNPITLGGKNYVRGIGTHAPCALAYELPDGYERFVSTAGIDDETGGQGSAVVSVLLDGRRVYQSGVLRGGDSPVEISIPTGGARRIVLEASPTGDGRSHDHVCWGAARLHRDSLGTAPPNAG